MRIYGVQLKNPFNSNVASGFGQDIDVVLMATKNKNENDKRCMLKLHDGFPPYVYSHVGGCKNSMKIWDN